MPRGALVGNQHCSERAVCAADWHAGLQPSCRQAAFGWSPLLAGSGSTWADGCAPTAVMTATRLGGWKRTFQVEPPTSAFYPYPDWFSDAAQPKVLAVAAGRTVRDRGTATAAGGVVIHIAQAPRSFICCVD
jgi:hypothetical protein